jgi:hypothetical protein
VKNLGRIEKEKKKERENTRTANKPLPELEAMEAKVAGVASKAPSPPI